MLADEIEDLDTTTPDSADTGIAETSADSLNSASEVSNDDIDNAQAESNAKDSDTEDTTAKDQRSKKRLFAVCGGWWSGGGDGFEVEFAAGQVDHGGEVVHVPEAAGTSFDVLDDAVGALEDGVGVRVLEVCDDPSEVASDHAGEVLHRLEAGVHHPRAQAMQAHPRLGRGAAVRVDVLRDLAHPAGAAGLQPLPRQVALGLHLQFGQAFPVPEPQALGPFGQRVGAAFRLPGLADGLVGVPGHVEPVDDPPRMGQMLTDALPEAQAHVAGDQTHIFRDPVVVHEIPREPFDRGRVLAGGHVGHVVLDEVGDHGDVAVSLAAGPVDADGLHSRVVLQPPRLVDVVGDGPPQAGVGLVDLLGERAGGKVAGHLHRPRLEQEREPAARPRPRDGNRPHPMHGTGDPRHTGVDERLVPEEVRMPPRALTGVMHRADGLVAPRLGTTEARARLETDRDAQLLPAVPRIPEIHGLDLPRRLQLQGGGEQVRGIHAPESLRMEPNLEHGIW